MSGGFGFQLVSRPQRPWVVNCDGGASNCWRGSRSCSPVTGWCRRCCTAICGAANVGCTVEGEPVIFDPACYYGDREADLAMTELFGGFPERFMPLTGKLPLDVGYPQRRMLYNLYHAQPSQPVRRWLPHPGRAHDRPTAGGIGLTGGRSGNSASDGFDSGDGSALHPSDSRPANRSFRLFIDFPVNVDRLGFTEPLMVRTLDAHRHRSPRNCPPRHPVPGGRCGSIATARPARGPKSISRPPCMPTKYRVCWWRSTCCASWNRRGNKTDGGRGGGRAGRQSNWFEPTPTAVCLGRFDGEGSGNFNRGFPDLAPLALERLRGRLRADPADNTASIRATLRTVLAEQRAAREADALKLALLGQAIDADFVFDLHCDGEALLHLYASRWQAEEARALGAEPGAVAILLEEEPGGNPFDEACAGPWWKLRAALATEGPVPLACFATTVELRGQADVSDEYAAADAAALLRFLQRRGVIAGEPEPLPEPRCQPTPLNGVDVLTAPVAGVLAYRKHLGDAVSAGEVVAELVDRSANRRRGSVGGPCRNQRSLFARMGERLGDPDRNSARWRDGNR